MISFDQFIINWNGRPLDYDGFYGYQCMDLYRQYVKEVLNVPQSPAVAGARFVWDTFNPAYYDKIPNGPTNFPLKGDIVIWGSGIGYYGHIAIAWIGDSVKFTSFDQNFPVGTYCHLQPHNYNYVLGWLHPKGIVIPPYTERQALLDIKAYEYSSSDDSTVRQRVKEVLAKIGV